MLISPKKEWFKIIWYEWEWQECVIVFQKDNDDSVIIKENYSEHMKKRYEETAEWRKKIMSLDNL